MPNTAEQYISQNISFASIMAQMGEHPILDAFPAGVAICDGNGVITQANAELLKLFGYTREELIGQRIEVLLPISHRNHHQSHLKAYMANPEKRVMGYGRDLFACRKDGSVFPVEVGLNPIPGSIGMRVLATVADITHRQQLENNFRAIVEAAPVGVLIIDAHGKIRHVNANLTRIFGYAAEELIGQKMEVLLPERYRKHHPDLREGFAMQPAMRSMGLNRDLTGLHKSGIEVPLEIGLSPIDTPEGRAVVATVVDITDRKRDEIRLRQLNADLDEFTYVASHDLRSPLRGISSLVDWIAEDMADSASEDVRNNLERIQVRISRMDKLVEDLLAYARSGRQTKDVKNVNLADLIHDVCRFVEPPAGFKIDIQENLGSIQISATPLETVLRNLISNAIKHHDQLAGLIQVRAHTAQDFYLFEVIDDGPGIPPNAQERIFKLFQTLSNTEGTRSGVGLAVCKRLVESHGGTISVESNPEKRGACFKFWWPRYIRSDINEQSR